MSSRTSFVATMLQMLPKFHSTPDPIAIAAAAHHRCGDTGACAFRLLYISAGSVDAAAGSRMRRPASSVSGDAQPAPMDIEGTNPRPDRFEKYIGASTRPPNSPAITATSRPAMRSGPCAYLGGTPALPGVAVAAPEVICPSPLSSSNSETSPALASMFANSASACLHLERAFESKRNLLRNAVNSVHHG